MKERRNDEGKWDRGEWVRKEGKKRMWYIIPVHGFAALIEMYVPIYNIYSLKFLLSFTCTAMQVILPVKSQILQTTLIFAFLQRDKHSYMLVLFNLFCALHYM